MALTKARLSLMVVITTWVGYALAPAVGWWSWGLTHTIFGTLLCAFGAAVFNQVLEIDADARMQRTADRPLPAQRIPAAGAFALGAAFSAWGLLHLASRVNIEATALAAATLVTYIFIYTPMKRTSSLNTLVGAISGAFPPMIGWAAARGVDQGAFRWSLLWEAPSLFLFALLFFWQLPHFIAINWMYREEYERGGFVMWSNHDESGKKSSRLALLYALPLLAVWLMPWWCGFAHWAASLGGVILSGVMIWYAWQFCRVCERTAARRLFFYTLLYLPVSLILLVALKR
jgi:heme o synthase